MPARRDTRIEASKVRRLSPLQPVEDQSQAWGIRCHSCTWREGLAPSWRTELQSLWLCDLPENRSSLSINGSHLRWWGIQPARLNLSSGRHLRRGMLPKFSTYKTRIWAMMLQNFRISSPHGALDPPLEQGC